MASFLDSLIGGVKDLTSGQGANDMLGKAKATWNNQSGATKGAIAGGLLAAILTGGGRRMIGTGVKVGGAALIGSLAYKAYEDWKAGKDAQAQDTQASPVELPPPAPNFLPQDQDAADALSHRLLKAMIAAANADGQITADEQARITGGLSQLGIADEAQALIADELAAPLEIGDVVKLATTEEEATEVYAASVMAVDPEGAVEKGYLALLAARLRLDPGLVSHIHAKAGALT